MSRLHKDGSDELVRLTRIGITAIFLTGLPLAVALAILSGQIIDFLHYPDGFEHSVPLLAILAMSLPLTGVLMLIGTTAAAVDRQADWARLVAAAVALKSRFYPDPDTDLRSGVRKRGHRRRCGPG